MRLVIAAIALTALVTAGFAQDDPREDYERIKAKVEKLLKMKDERIARLEEMLAKQKKIAELAAANASAAALEADLLKRQLAQAKAANDRNHAAIEKQSAQLAALRESMEKYSGWMKKIAKASEGAEIVKIDFEAEWKAELAKRVARDDRVSDLEAENVRLRQKLRSAEFWVQKYRKWYGQPPRPQRGSPGLVTRVDGQVVTLSVGSEDGVKVGAVYQLRRGNTYVGQVRITKVGKDSCTGEFDEKLKGPGAPPIAGDVAEPPR